MRRNILFVILFVFFISAFSSAQTVFERYYTFNIWSNGLQAVELPGQGYFIAGYDDSLVVDSNGQPVTIFIQGLLLHLDYNGQLIKSRFMGNGDTLYTYLYGDNSDDYFRSLLKMNDGNLMVFGETQSYNPRNYYDYSLWMIKFNSNLDTLWSQRFSIPDSQLAMNFSRAKKTFDDGYIIPGHQVAFTNGNYQGKLTRVDSSGNIVFHQRVLPQYLSRLNDVVQSQDGGFISVGVIYNDIFNDDFSPLVIKSDSMGRLDWFYTLPFSGDKHIANSIIPAGDGNYLYIWANVNRLPGGRWRYWEPHVTKIDQQGNEIWTKEYGYTFDYWWRINELAGGNFMQTGWYTDTLSFNMKAFILVCNANGDTLWSRKYGDPNNSTIREFDGIQTSDGGFLLTGETYCCNFVPGMGRTSSVWALKTDSLGLVTSVVNLPAPELPANALGLPYPNPVESTTSIPVLVPPGMNSAELLLFNSLGKQLQSRSLKAGMNHVQLDFTDYAKGEYLIALSLDGFNSGVRKIIKH